MVVGALALTGSVALGAYNARGGRKTISDINYGIKGGYLTIKSDKTRQRILTDIQKLTADAPFIIPAADVSGTESSLGR